jgi:hypothetical protein
MSTECHGQPLAKAVSRRSVRENYSPPSGASLARFSPMIATLLQPTVTPADPELLFQLQLRVARRADEVVRESADSLQPAWLAWIQAEREVFAALER